MWNVEHALIHFLTLVISLVSNGVSCIHDVIRFEQKTVAHFTLETGSTEVLMHNRPEERQKLCFYAKRHAVLAYINYSYVPEWRTHEPDSPSDPFHCAMYCPTLPTIYLLKKSHSSLVQITFLESSVHRYKFNEEIVKPNSVTPIHEGDDHSSREFEESDFTKLNIEDRRNLCVAAVDLLALYFINHNVGEAQLYKFEYAPGKTETHVSIPCPTLPQLYLYRGNSNTELTLALLRGPMDEYKFEMEPTQAAFVSPMPENEHIPTVTGNSLAQLDPVNRVKFCATARTYYASQSAPFFVEDVEVPEARLYSFQYTGGTETHNIAILCSAVPSFYLRLLAAPESNRIKLTVVQTLADRYVYIVKILDHLYAKRSDKITEFHRNKIEEHPFTTLGTEIRQHFCLVARSHILEDVENRLNFRFSSKEPVLADPKLLVIPKYVSKPFMYVLEHLNGEKEKDIVLVRCSAWPQMYIRLGKTDEELDVILLDHELI